jgi:ubiquitin-like 1-activating enzyme E1 A
VACFRSGQNFLGTVMVELTDEQVAIYDRQIRVWGADVQKRLMRAKVLLIGCTSLASEVAKNFILAGIGKLTLIDDTLASKVPLNFLYKPELAHSGATVAVMFAAGLQELNPMVTVQAAPGSVTELPQAALIKDYHLVLNFGLHAGHQRRLNDCCRAQGVSFIAARSYGSQVVAFVDLLTHQCRITSEGEGHATSDGVTLTYNCLMEAVAAPWCDLPEADKRQLNPILPVWTVVAQAEIEHNRAAHPDDFEELDKTGRAREARWKCKSGVWRADLLRELLNFAPDLAAVDAVFGGFLGNDVVRCLSHVGLPTHNVLVFRMADNVVQTHNLTGTSNAVHG